MSQPSIDTSRTTRTGRSRALALPLVAAILMAVGVWTMNTGANADTATNHTIVASTSSQTNVAKPGPLTGLTDGQPVTVRVTQASPSDPVNGIVSVRQCKGGVTIKNAAELVPSNTGYCTTAAIGQGSPAQSNLTKAQISDSFIEFTFKVGVGTKQVTFDDGNGTQTSTIQCDSAHDCSLWLQIGRTGGSDFVHFDLQLAGAGTTTTTAPTTSTTGATTTSTTAGGSTTSTTAGATTTSTTIAATTTSTTAPSTTSTAPTTTSTIGGATSTTTGASTTSTTTAASSTTSTTSTTTGGSSTTSTTTGGSTTSTTLPEGTDVQPTAVAGGTIAVDSDGWEPGSTVTGILHSDPVTLGTLTADDDGAITGTFAVPASTAAGAHTLELTGTDADGEPRTLTAPVTITAQSVASSTTSTTVATGGLARTGADTFRTGVSAALMIVAGYLFVQSAVQRRRTL